VILKYDSVTLCIVLHSVLNFCIITGPPTHSVEARLVTVVAVCRRRRGSRPAESQFGARGTTLTHGAPCRLPHPRGIAGHLRHCGPGVAYPLYHLSTALRLSSVTLPAGGPAGRRARGWSGTAELVGGRAADTAQRASTVTYR